jgi:glycosyltransferase involved in cell wall biosynthesis
MKIAYIYPEELPSKKARAISVVNTAYELSKIIDASLYISSNSKEKQEISKQYNLDLKDLKVKNISKTFLGIKSNKFFNKNLLKVILKDNINFVYVRHLKAAKFLLENSENRFKVIFECHEIFYETFKEENPSQIKKIENLKSLEEYVYKNVDALTFSNKTLQSHFQLTFGKLLQNEQIIVYNGMNFNDKFIEKDFTNINRLFYVGNFFKWKGIEDAINLISLNKSIVLEILGGDSLERTNELIALTKKLNVEKEVDFQGYKPTEDVKRILQNEAKITLIPNIKSIQNDFSMPIKLFEYMATSNIVIAADMNTIKEIINDGINGFLFESGNINSFNNVLQKVLSKSNEELREISKNAYETSKEYTWVKRAEKIAKLIKEFK